VHDEIILEAPEPESKRVAEILRETMETAGRFFLKTVPVVADVSIADSWADN
jgi:DNA polymerase I-like protein with 3'-5' exonuclease and polymerase domains